MSTYLSTEKHYKGNSTGQWTQESAQRCFFSQWWNSTLPFQHRPHTKRNQSSCVYCIFYDWDVTEEILIKISQTVKRLTLRDFRRGMSSCTKVREDASKAQHDKFFKQCSIIYHRETIVKNYHCQSFESPLLFRKKILTLFKIEVGLPNKMK